MRPNLIAQLFQFDKIIIINFFILKYSNEIQIDESHEVLDNIIIITEATKKYYF